VNARLILLFDVKDPVSYLALAPFRELAAEAGGDCAWYPFPGRVPGAPAEPEPDAGRGAWHRWHRARYREEDLRRYARARQLPARRFFDAGLYRQASGTAAAYGFNWAARSGPAAADAYLGLAFGEYWDGDLDVDSSAAIATALARAGVAAGGFEAYCAAEAAAELDEQREQLVALGAFGAPACLLDGEVFLGRQHVPYVRARLAGALA
jgi:2-hydroxychromene-2-carboxylate isomerase